MQASSKTNIAMWDSVPYNYSLLLASLVAFLLALARYYFAKHDNTISIHEGDTRQPLTILEGITDERLLWLKAALRHLVGFQRMRVLHLLTTRFLSHLPFEFRDAASRPATPHEP